MQQSLTQDTEFVTRTFGWAAYFAAKIRMRQPATGHVGTKRGKHESTVSSPCPGSCSRVGFFVIVDGGTAVPRGFPDPHRTPLIGPLPVTGAALSWRGKAYEPDFPDGYEVRVMVAPNTPTGGTGVIGNQITYSTVVFSTSGDAAVWTPHTVDLSLYVGQSVYIGFRNNSNDRFLVGIDDIKVTTIDLAAAAAPGFAVNYSRVPDGISVEANYAVVASNFGSTTFTNVTGSAQPTLNGSAQGAPVSSASVPSLVATASTTLSFGGPHLLSGSGNWGVTYTVSASEIGSDSDPSNNVVQVASIAIGGNEWARHEGPSSGVLGIGESNGGEIGTTFTLIQTASFEGIRFGMGAVPDPTPGNPPSNFAGHSMVANLRSTDGTGKPGALIATTEAITGSQGGGMYDVKFVNGPQTLAPGTYFVGVVEPVVLDVHGIPVYAAMPLLVHLQRFVTGTSWANWPTIPGGTWRSLESFGDDRRVVPNVSLLSEVSLFKDGFELHGDPPAGGAAALTNATDHKAESSLANISHT